MTRSRRDVAGDFWQLTKPRIVMMILVTTAATAVIGAGGGVPVSAMLWLLVGTGLVAAAAGSANQVWESRIDAAMTRTASRPLPAGRLNRAVAGVYSLALLIAGTMILWGAFSVVPAAFGWATWATYVFVYTPMKVRTTLNTTVGAIAGALPVMIGYTATGGEVFSVAGWLLFVVLAAWQYPHFMAIAWMYRRQYGEAGFKMTPSVKPDGWSAAVQAIVGSGVLIAAAVMLVWSVVWPVGSSQWAIGYGVVASGLAVAAGWPMLAASVRFYRQRNDAAARRLLRSSLLVLPAVLVIATAGVLF